MHKIGTHYGHCVIRDYQTDDQGRVTKSEITYSGSFDILATAKKGKTEPVVFARVPGTDLFTRNFSDNKELLDALSFGKAAFS